jgi:PAS domain S-box-containing protein
MSSVEPSNQLVNALMVADRMWETTIDALPDAVYIFDVDRRLKKINRAGEATEQATRAFLAGRRCCDMIWGLHDAECMVDRAISSGRAIEVEIPADNKAQRPLLVRVLPRNAEQQQQTHAGCIVIARDVSELRYAEEEASKHRAFLASLADLAPDEIYTLDVDARFTWMNKRAEADSGLTPSVLLGHEFTMIVSTESKDEAKRALQTTLGGEEQQFEIKTICADSRVRCMEAHTSPLWHDGSITGVMVFMSDVTEKKLAQERAARSDKLRALGELAAGVAHNLNNSLTVIQGRAQLLLMRSGENENVKKSLEVITQAVADCSQTLRRLLDFSRREATKTKAPVDLSELVTSSIEIARPKWQGTAANRTGTVEVNVDAPHPVFTLGDSAELREVVLNLIFNAVDAMPQGGTIEISTRSEGNTARFAVADTGTGMPPEIVARIFEPFYSTKGERGTGLGLSASHGIVENHGGGINVTSEAGKGTRFEIVLPLHEPAARANVATTQPETEHEAARVLIVEDEERVRALLKETFCAAGHQVTEAITGADALKLLDQGKFDLLICDLGLPEISGLHVARWVKEFRPELPVIIATGYSEMITAEDYEKARIDEVIRKPFAVTDLLQRAHQLLPLKSANQPETTVAS